MKTIEQIRALIAEYTMGNYNPMYNDRWRQIRENLLEIKQDQIDLYRSAVLDVVESVIRLLNIKEFGI